MQVTAEYTDTFAGEANYTWINRTEVTAKNERDAVRKVKSAFGLTGHRCRRMDVGDEIWLYPQGTTSVVFIYF